MIIKPTCPFCNFSRELGSEKIPSGVSYVTCPRCNQRFEYKDPGPEFSFGHWKKDSEKEGPAIATPWERRDELGILRAVSQTFKSVLFSPVNFFKGMPQGEGIGEPFAFGLLTGSLGTMFGLFWQFLLVPDRVLSLSSTLSDRFEMNLLFLVILVVSPVFIILNMFITGGLIHLCLLIVRGGRSGFEGTFRVIAFSQATQILSLVPFIGSLTSLIWRFIIIVIGLRETHRISYLRVFAAFLFPVGLLLLLSAGLLLSLLMYV